MLSAKIVAQKPSGRVTPTASPLQSVVAAWLGSIPHEVTSISAAAATGPHDHRTIEPTGNRHVCVIEQLRIVQTFAPKCPATGFSTEASSILPAALVVICLLLLLVTVHGAFQNRSRT